MYPWWNPSWAEDLATQSPSEPRACDTWELYGLLVSQATKGPGGFKAFLKGGEGVGFFFLWRGHLKTHKPEMPKRMFRCYLLYAYLCIYIYIVYVYTHVKKTHVYSWSESGYCERRTTIPANRSVGSKFSSSNLYLEPEQIYSIL